jgi:hypothetical protein
LKPTDTHGLTNLHFKEQQHAMVLYRSDDQDAATSYVNEALNRGYVTVYLPITSSLSESFDYEENVNRGNLLTFSTGTFYGFAVAGDMQPFEELKVLIEEAIEEKRIASKRNDKNEEAIVVLVVGVAAELLRNGKVDEAVKLEKWWQETHFEWLHKGLKVNIICPHLSLTFDRGEFMQFKQVISSLHDVVV